MNRDRTNNHIQADDAIESRITGLLANVEREMSEMQRVLFENFLENYFFFATIDHK